MKKLIVAALTVAMAVVANASSVKWSMANGVLSPSPDGSAQSGRCSYYTMLIFTDSQADAVNSAITAGNFESLGTMAVSSAQSAKAGSFTGVVNGLTGTSPPPHGVLCVAHQDHTVGKKSGYTKGRCGAGGLRHG